jgi:outer membrane protein assembly factor BamB
MIFRTVVLGWMAVVVLSAASPQAWEISDFESFLKGRFESVSLDSEGNLRLAPKLTPLLESEEALAWATAVADDGAIYLGTGHQGRLFRIAPDGTAKLHWQAPEIEIFALAAAPDGRLFAATAPNGKVYEVDAQGEGKPLFDPQQSYIWALQLSSDNQHLYAATGDEGRVFRIPLDRSGEGELWLETGQRHAISLALSPDGKLLVGTDPNGLLYRVDGKQQAFALYDADLPEIRAIAVSASGEIFFAAMGGAMSLRDQTTQIVSTAVTAAAIAEGSQPSTAGLTVPTVNYGVETATLFRLRPEQSVDNLWSSKEEDILGLDFDPSDPSRLLFITGRAGRVYRLDPAEDRVELLAQTDQRQATSLRTVGSTALLSAAYGGALARLEARPAEQGEYTTGVRDAGAVSQWGRLSWRGEGRIVFSTRTGNSPTPDATWSDWSAPIESPGGGPVVSPPARYIQWRARLERTAGEPLLEQATLSYLPQNQGAGADGGDGQIRAGLGGRRSLGLLRRRVERFDGSLLHHGDGFRRQLGEHGRHFHAGDKA